MALSLPRTSDGEPHSGMPPLNPVDGGIADVAAPAAPGGGVPPAHGADAPEPKDPAAVLGLAAMSPDGAATNATAPGAAPDRAANRPPAGTAKPQGIRLEDPRAYPTMAGAPDDRWLRQLIGREGTWVTARNFRSAYLTVPDPREEGTYVPIVRDNGERVAVGFLEASNNPDNDYPPPGRASIDGSGLGEATGPTARSRGDERPFPTGSGGTGGAKPGAGGEGETGDGDDPAASPSEGEGEAIPPEDVARIFADLEAWDRREEMRRPDDGAVVVGTDDGPGDTPDVDDAIGQLNPASIPNPVSFSSLARDIEEALDRTAGHLQQAERAALAGRIREALEPVAALPAVRSLLDGTDSVGDFLAAVRAWEADDPALVPRFEIVGSAASVAARVAAALVTLKKLYDRWRRSGSPGRPTPPRQNDDNVPELPAPTEEQPPPIGHNGPPGPPLENPWGPGEPAREDHKEAVRRSAERMEALRRDREAEYRRPAEVAFRETDLASPDPAVQVRRGKAAMDMLIAEVRRGGPRVVRDAMYRPDLPGESKFVHFHWGKPGNKRFYRAHGWSHVISKHGPEDVEGVIETIARGTRLVPEQPPKDGRIVLEHVHKGRRYLAVLGMVQENEGQEPIWVITGYSTGEGNQANPFDLNRIGSIFFE